LARTELDADDPQLKITLEKTAELETLLSLNEDLLATVEQERADFLELMPGFERGRFRKYNSDCTTRIFRILNGSAAKMRETVPTLQSKLFKNFEGVQRQYDLLPRSFRG
jgi:hypothetical protein